jgi:hypothetical protein
MHQCVKEARMMQTISSAKNQRFEVQNPVAKGLLNYITMPWNWFGMFFWYFSNRFKNGLS